MVPEVSLAFFSPKDPRTSHMPCWGEITVPYQWVNTKKKPRWGFSAAGTGWFDPCCSTNRGVGVLEEGARGGNPGPSLDPLGALHSLENSSSKDSLEGAGWLCGIPVWQSLQMLYLTVSSC